MDIFRFGFIACVGLGVAGCATNVIRLDRAETMTGAGRAASLATERLMTRARSENRSALVEIVALDPQCSLPEPTIASQRDYAKRKLCQ